MRVVAAVVTHQERFLACRRAEHKSLAGFWEFPGGKVEPGEGDQEALVREVQEELGIQIEVGNFICRSTSNSSGTEIEMFTYFCRLNSAPPTSSSDHDQLIWVSKAELADLMWPPLDIPVVDALMANMS